MIDYVNLNPKLERLEQYVSYLKGYQKYSIEEIKRDHTLQGAVLHYLQLAIESTLDIGEFLISAFKLRKPEESRDVIKILGENRIIPEDFAQRFGPVASFRNILVHEYAKVDMGKVYHHLQNDLSDFDFFTRHIANFLKKQIEKQY